ncbi:MAG: hypothetical protein R3B45_16255 [Bdellovibrionota bacterium]
MLDFIKRFNAKKLSDVQSIQTQREKVTESGIRHEVKHNSRKHLYQTASKVLGISALLFSNIVPLAYGNDNTNQLAQGEYIPPSTPPLYESNGAPGTKLTHRSGLYVGGNLQFGQSRSAGGSANPIAAYIAGAEIGYVAGTGSWDRYEAAFEAFTGKVGHSEADMPINMGAMIKIGKAYSLGSNFWGVWGLGAGMAQIDYKTEIADRDVEAVDPVLGLALQGAYSLVMPVGKYMSLNAGIRWTHMSFNIQKLKDSETGTKIDRDDNVIINMPAVQLGVRLGI